MRNPFKRDPDPFAASRFDGIVRGVRTRRRRHMRHWWQWALIALFVSVTAVSGWGVWLYYSTQGKVQRDLPVSERNEVQPFNALLVGSDSREGLTEQEQFELGARAVGGERADTLILAHIDPRTESVTMVQFPRDLYIPIAGGGSDKINAALLGGPDQLIDTVKQLTGLDIHQYVQVNIAGFRDLVEAVGGIDVCIAEPIPFDPNTGLEVTEEEIGMVHLDGDRAIRFVRSRNFTTGDFERIQNQQKFVAAAINKVTSSATLLNPSRVTRLVKVAGENLVTDQHTTILGLRNVAQRLGDFDPERYEAYIAPNEGIGNIDGISVVLPDREAMNVMFDAIRRNESPALADGIASVEPSTVRVGVYNGTGVDGTASNAAAALEEATNVGAGPVRILEVADADRTNYRKSVIRYEPAAEKLAELVAAAVPGAELEEAKTGRGLDVEVIVGRRFETRPLVELIPLPLPKKGEVPEVCRRQGAGAQPE